jgi:non-ribosomal peptide synthetase component E (peptide arylation enzyme)
MELPSSYEFVDMLPKTSVGKVDKLALRQRAKKAGA